MFDTDGHFCETPRLLPPLLRSLYNHEGREKRGTERRESTEEMAESVPSVWSLQEGTKRKHSAVCLMSNRVSLARSLA